MRRPTTAIIALLALAAAAAPALGRKRDTAPKVNARHCEIGGVEVDKSKKACKKAGGVWEYGPPRLPAQPTAAPPASGR